MTRRDGRALPPLYLALSLGAGLGLLMPLVALGLVLAYGFGHLHGTFRLFLGYLTLTGFALALPRVIRLGQTLRVGKLRVSSVMIERTQAPRWFWAWVAFEALLVALNLVAAVFLLSVTLG